MRWTGPFETPNQAGLILAASALIIICVFHRWLMQTGFELKKRRSIALLACYAFIIVVVLHFLTLTCSRAAWLAFTAALIAAAVLGGIPKRFLALYIPLLFVMVLGNDAASGRASKSVADMVEGERLTLWRTTLAMIHDQWWSGYGERFVDVLNMWYIPEELKGRFITALNDPLTISARFGILALYLYVTLFWMLCECFWLARKNWLVPVLASALVVHVVCGQFQAHMFYRLTFMTSMLLLTLAIAVLVWTALIGKSISWKLLLSTGARALLFGALVLVTAWGVSAQASKTYPHEVHLMPRAAMVQKRNAVVTRCVILNVTTVEEYNFWVRRGGEQFIPDSAGLLVAIGISIPDSLAEVPSGIDDPKVIWSVQEGAVPLLEWARDASTELHCFIIDPHGVTEEVDGHRSISRVTLLVGRNAPFLPSKLDMKRCLESFRGDSQVIDYDGNMIQSEVIDRLLSDFPW